MFTVKRATTGRVGQETYDNRILCLNTFSTLRGALNEMRSRRRAYEEKGIIPNGTDRDYTVTLKDEKFDCVDRYWVEEA